MPNYFNLQQLPIAQLHTWSNTYPSKPKRPIFPVTSLPRQLYTLDNAILHLREGGNLGIILLQEYPYIVIDIDDSATIPESLQEFITPDSTYIEKSLSGTGLHVVLQLDEQAHQLFKLTYNLKYVKSNSSWEGQISFSRNFMVMTGDKLEEAPNFIKIMTLENMTQLLQASASTLFMKKYFPEEVKQQKQQKLQKEIDKILKSTVSGFSELKRIVMDIPLDQGLTIRTAYEKLTGSAYCHYDLWLTVGMAIHYESKLLNDEERGYRLFLNWSKTDPTAYTGEAAVRDKWDSFTLSTNNPNPNQITGNTLRALQVSSQYTWPVTVKGKPDTSSIENMQYGLQQLKLQLFSLPGLGIFIKGPEDIIKEYFNETNYFINYRGPIIPSILERTFCLMFQKEFNWKGVGWMKLLREMIFDNMQQLNPIHTWLSAKPTEFTQAQQEQDNITSSVGSDTVMAPEDCTLDYVLDSFEFQEGADIDLCKLKITKFLMQIIKMSRPELVSEPNEGMLILSGPENTRKTSFFKYLFPQMLNFCTGTWFEDFQSDKQKRDFNRLLASKALIYLDECDTIFKTGTIATEFKKILTSTTVEYTEIFSTTGIQVPRLAVLAGTTNVDKLQMSNTGSRRIWFVPIAFINMERLNKMSRYHFFKNLEKEFDKRLKENPQEPPWIMTQDESKEVVSTNYYHSTVSNARALLNELFPVTTTKKMDQKTLNEITKSPQKARVDHPHCFTLKRLQAIIRENFPYARMPAPTEIRHAAADISMQYTRIFKAVPLDNGWVYNKGQISYPKDPGKKYLVLPKLQDD